MNELLDCFLVQSIVDGRVFCVDIDFAVGEAEPLFGFLINDNVNFDLVTHARGRLGKYGMDHHLLPGGPLERFMLHRLVQKVEGVERDEDV